MLASIYDNFDPETMTFIFLEEDDEGLETVHEIAAKYEVCTTCRGRGKHSRDIDGHGITQEERERDWDDESWEHYVRGDYDRTCEACHGSRVIPVIDHDRVEPELVSKIEKSMRELAEMIAIEELERRSGA